MDYKKMSPGERLKYIRKGALKISMEELGEKIGKTRSSMSYVESGKADLTEANAKAICSNYDISYDWLMFGEGEPMLDSKTALLANLKDKYHLSNDDMKLLRSYMSLDQNDREAIKKFIAAVNQDEDDQLNDQEKKN